VKTGKGTSYHAKLGAWLIVLFLIGVTPMHKFWGVTDPMMQQMQLVMFMKNVAMLGGALLISQLGSGPWSLDNRNAESSQREPVRQRKSRPARAAS
jgi:putative oxidoreductase